MGKKAAGLVCIFLLMVILTGCQLIRIEEGERTPLKYTIVKQEEIPAEAVELMEQKKEKTFQMTYQVGDVRYLMKGYGEQLTGGYSIQVEEVSESENAVFCKTRLIISFISKVRFHSFVPSTLCTSERFLYKKRVRL